MLTAYHPTNHVSLRGFVLLFLFVIVGGLVLGGLAWSVSQLFWLIFVFPVVLGGLAGTALAKIIAVCRVRHPLIAVVCAMVMSLMIIGIMHYGDYLQFQSELQEVIATEFELQEGMTYQKIEDAFLNEKTGSTGFVGFMNLAAQEGVSIGKVGRPSINLTGPFAWLYWLFELVLIAGFAISIAYSAASQPFCGTCGDWFQGGQHLGTILPHEHDRFKEYLRTGSFRQAGLLLVQSDGASPSLELYLQPCANASVHDSILSLKRMWRDAKGRPKFTTLFEAKITAHSAEELRQGDAAQEPVAAWT